MGRSVLKTNKKVGRECNPPRDTSRYEYVKVGAITYHVKDMAYQRILKRKKKKKKK